jgi:tetratricopeptide (TPR) repeat protein
VISIRGQGPGSRIARKVCGRFRAGILALFFLNPLFGQRPETTATLNQRGTHYLQQGDFVRALEAYQAAEKLQPADPAIQFNLGLALYRAGRLRDALGPLAKAKQAAASRRQATYLRGVILFSLNDLEACVGEIGGLREDPEYGEAVLYMLVESNRRLARAQDSQTAFVELSKRYPDSAFLHKLMGMAYESQYMYKEALQEFQAALRVNPSMPEMNFAVGFVLLKQHQLDEARPWFEKELALQSCYAPALYALGEVERKKSRPAGAEKLYRRAIACDNSYADAYLGLGMTLEELGSNAEAIQAYQEAARRAPQDSDAHYRLARALDKAGRHDEAKAEFAKVRELKKAAGEKTLQLMSTGEEQSQKLQPQ